jgi:hypothetical protein
LVLPDITREDLINAAKRAAAEASGPLSRSDFVRVSGITEYLIYRLFPEGGWSELRSLAGLQRHPNDNEPLTDEELLTEFHRVATELGRIPTWAILESRAHMSVSTVKRRFGGLPGTLQKYREWLQQKEPNSPLLSMIQVRSRHEILAPGPAARFPSPSQWQKGDGTVYGAPISFRGLRHAPINEQGVVYLFGMVSSELGLIVEAIQSAYPDCEAKRCVDTRQNRWQRVRIEFEFLSSNFREHGHDPAGCDMIVCWEHDWPDCPLEVIELRTVIDQLEG